MYYYKIFLFLCITVFLNCFVYYSSDKIYVIISSCQKKKELVINTLFLPFTVIKLYCNSSTNHIDSLEAGLMLDFIIKKYNKKGNFKYIFLHDHTKSWHYTENIYKRLYYLKKNNYLYNVKFGGLYCTYAKFGCKRPYDIMFNRSYEVDKYMRSNGFINISMLQLYTHKYIFPCCSTFVVHNSRIVHYPLIFYKKLRKGLKQYVIKTKQNHLSANYMEYMWSIIFGIKNVDYPPDCDNKSMW